MWSSKEMKMKARYSLMPYYLKSVFAVIICNAISNLLNLIIPTNQNVAPQTMTEEGFTELLNAISNNLGLGIGIISVFFLISLILHYI